MAIRNDYSSAGIPPATITLIMPNHFGRYESCCKPLATEATNRERDNIDRIGRRKIFEHPKQVRYRLQIAGMKIPNMILAN